MSDEPPAYVPVPTPALDDALRDARAVEEALEAQRAALTRLSELAEDLCADATRGLRDRGASPAQIERYEGATADARRGAREAWAEAAARVEALVRALERLR